MSKYFTIDLAIKKLQLLVGAPGEGSQHVWTQKRTRQKKKKKKEITENKLVGFLIWK